jgi:ABC-type multidrug transport system ATPase subunit
MDKTQSYQSELHWSNLSVCTKPSQKTPSKSILNNSEGIVHPGEFLAIMGPSGAGKTTLLNCLSGKHQSTLIQSSGIIQVNGFEISSIEYKSMIGFVPQDDILIDSMTVRETFDFSASLTLDLKAEERAQVVQDMIEELALTGCSESLVGGTIIRGISGGEKKRVSIGVELIFNPPILFLDEPTTGLDSFNALSIIQLLSKVAKEKNITVVATIHQPSSRIFMNFDRLLLLSFGNTIFMGNAGLAVEHFKELGFPIKPNYNPGDHFMEVMCTEKFKLVEFRESLRSRAINGSMSTSLFSKPEGHYHAPFFASLLFLIRRDLKHIKRNPIIIKGQLMKMCITVALGTMTFANLGTDLFDIYDRYGALFLLSNNVLIDMLNTSLTIFLTVKPIFLREYSARKYSSSAFLLSFIITRLPIELISSLGTYGISYYIFKLNPLFSHFLMMNVIGFLAAFTGSAFGLLVSVIAPNLEAASALAPIIFLPTMLSGGYVVTYDKVPKWFFIQYISPFRYALESTVRVDFDDNPDLNQLVRDKGIETLDMPESYTEGIVILAALGIGIKLLSVVALYLLNRKI